MLTEEQLIGEAVEDAKKDVRRRKDVVKTRLLNFYRWLKEEYPRKSRGCGSHRIIGTGLSDSTASTMIGAIRSFHSTYDIYVRARIF